MNWRLLILDFDGVVSTPTAGLFSPILLERVNKIVRKTRALVILSSNWRQDWPVSLLTQALRERGAQFRIVDAIPILPGKTRGQEIAAWLERAQIRHAKLAILDDLGPESFGQFEYWHVQTDPELGLQDRHADKAIWLLQAKEALDWAELTGLFDQA